MTTVVFASEMLTFTQGQNQVNVNATNYRGALRELSLRFPALTSDLYEQFSIAIDGVIVHRPLLEALEPGGEMVFIPRIASG